VPADAKRLITARRCNFALLSPLDSRSRCSWKQVTTEPHLLLTIWRSHESVDRKDYIIIAFCGQVQSS